MSAAPPVRIETMPGHEITSTIKRAINAAASLSGTVAFDFNAVEVVVAADSNPDLICRDWQRGMFGYHKDVVGPYPAAELSAEAQASDARIKAENEARWAAQQAEYDRKAEEKRIRLDAEIGHEAIRFADDKEADWRTFAEANQDPYGSAVVRFADKWARLMQVRLRAGGKLDEIADAASHDADDEGITGFMYGCAVSLLSRCWERGEALRQWHNLKTQIGDEGERANESGGVLNPALLCAGP
jgi:hypothetical protein